MAKKKKETPLENRIQILADFWMECRDDVDFADFIEYNDLGLPLAYILANGFVEGAKPVAENFINETFELLLEVFEVEDNNYIDLGDLLDIYESKII